MNQPVGGQTSGGQGFPGIRPAGRAPEGGPVGEPVWGRRVLLSPSTLSATGPRKGLLFLASGTMRPLGRGLIPAPPQPRRPSHGSVTILSSSGRIPLGRGLIPAPLQPRRPSHSSVTILSSSGRRPSGRMTVLFLASSLSRLVLLRNLSGTMTPLVQLTVLFLASGTMSS